MTPLEMHAIVRGRVQGVFFRATARHHAQKIGLTGTAKNLSDGTVEIYAQGTQDQLSQFELLLKEDQGPSHIDAFIVDTYPPVKTFDSFDVIF